MIDVTGKKSDERAEELLDAELIDAWRAMLGTEGGRLILWSILDKCAMFQFAHYGDSTDTLLRGRQQVGAMILNDFVFPHGMAYYTDTLLEAEARQNRIEMAAEQAQREDEQEQ